MGYGFGMRHWVLALLCSVFVGIASTPADNPASGVFTKADRKGKVVILPIRDDIMPPMLYVVRRGVKLAMEEKADVLVIDMDTNGGRVDVTEEIIEIINKFPGLTVTFVNKKAFSAGAFISFATRKIYMAPQSVIGAAAPILMSPGGTGVEQMPDTLEAKTVSAISALVRANAEKNGHNVEVADAMVKKTKELIIDGKTLNEKGQILTLTNREAEEEYGDPPQKLLSAGTVENLNELFATLGYAEAERDEIQPTGVEKLAFWINAISPVLLIIGMVGIYIEIKTPGFGLPGIVGIVAFALYFLGGYIAGLSGMEWLAVFVIGLVLVVLEFFVFTGTVVLGLAGILLMLIAVVMALADVYPAPLPDAPILPSFESLQAPLGVLATALLGGLVAIALVARFLPQVPILRTMVSDSASGVASVEQQARDHTQQIGQSGVAISSLRPGGKAQFGERILDVVTQGELIAKGAKVRIIGHSATEAVVEEVEGA